MAAPIPVADVMAAEAEAIKVPDALWDVPVNTKRVHAHHTTGDELKDLKDLLSAVGGRREDRTRDLRIANAALSQLS